MKNKLITASILGALAVIMGAFGAHSLKSLISADSLYTYHTAVNYQFYHVFAIYACAFVYQNSPSKIITYAAISFIIGITLFSGSLYLLSTRAVTGLDNFSILGPLTPVGGLFFIIGWVCLAFGIGRTTVMK